MRKFFVAVLFTLLTATPAIAQEAKTYPAKLKNGKVVRVYTNADLRGISGKALPKANPDGVVTVTLPDGTTATGYIYVSRKNR